MLAPLKVGDREIHPKLISIDDERWVAVSLADWQEMTAFVRQRGDMRLEVADDAFVLWMEGEQQRTDREETMTNLVDLTRRLAAEEVEEARTQKRISRKQLAELAGLEEDQIRLLEEEPTRVSVATLRKAGAALGLSLRL